MHMNAYEYEYDPNECILMNAYNILKRTPHRRGVASRYARKLYHYYLPPSTMALLDVGNTLPTRSESPLSSIPER
jgi:hypothetical protein